MVDRTTRYRLDEQSISNQQLNLKKFQEMLIDANNFLLGMEGIEFLNDIPENYIESNEKMEKINAIIDSIVGFAQQKTDLLEDEQIEQLKSELSQLVINSKLHDKIPDGLLRLAPIMRNVFFPIIQNLKVKLSNNE